MRSKEQGQVLVLFLLLLPLFLMILAFVVDQGMLVIEKKTIKSGIEEAIRYALTSEEESHVKEEKMRVLLQKNLDRIENVTIQFNEGVTVTLTSRSPSLFGNFLKNNTLSYQYHGSLQGDQIVIERGENHGH